MVKKSLLSIVSWSLRLLIVFVMLSGSGLAYPPMSMVSADENGTVLLSDSFDRDFEWEVMTPRGNWGHSQYRSDSGDYSAYCAQEDGYPQTI